MARAGSALLMTYEITPEGLCSVLVADLNSIVYQQRTVNSAKMAKKCPKNGGNPPNKSHTLIRVTFLIRAYAPKFFILPNKSHTLIRVGSLFKKEGIFRWTVFFWGGDPT